MCEEAGSGAFWGPIVVFYYYYYYYYYKMELLEITFYHPTPPSPLASKLCGGGYHIQKAKMAGMAEGRTFDIYVRVQNGNSDFSPPISDYPYLIQGCDLWSEEVGRWHCWRVASIVGKNIIMKNDECFATLQAPSFSRSSISTL